MKKLIMTAALSALASTAFAGGEKTSILHCGCNDTGDGMVYKEIRVSSKSKGHVGHDFGSSSSCFAGYSDDPEPVEIYVDAVRTSPDCTVEGPTLSKKGTDMSLCEELELESAPVAGDPCGEVDPGPV